MMHCIYTFAAYKFVFHCNDALEAENHALMQGMALAIQDTDLPVIVQADSSMALLILADDYLDCFAYGHLAKIKALLVDREFIP